MVVIIKFGRRIPHQWFKRGIAKIGGLLTFQENMWIMICQSIKLAKRKAVRSHTLQFVTERKEEQEDLNYDLEWLIVTIKGTEKQEQDEYMEAMQIYTGLDRLMKPISDKNKDERMSKVFKSMHMTPEQFGKAYSEGLTNVKGESIAKKLLDLGIIISIEKVAGEISI